MLYIEASIHLTSIAGIRILTVDLIDPFAVLRKWGPEEFAGFLACPVGFVLVQYVIFLARFASEASRDIPGSHRESMTYGDIRIFATTDTGGGRLAEHCAAEE